MRKILAHSSCIFLTAPAKKKKRKKPEEYKVEEILGMKVDPKTVSPLAQTHSAGCGSTVSDNTERVERASGAPFACQIYVWPVGRHNSLQCPR